jgi:hypothetical protein
MIAKVHLFLFIHQDLCQKCVEDGRPCWTPHRVSDCRDCQRSRWKCCFDARPFLGNCLIVSIKVLLHFHFIFKKARLFYNVSFKVFIWLKSLAFFGTISITNLYLKNTNSAKTLFEFSSPPTVAKVDQVLNFTNHYLWKARPF